MESRFHYNNVWLCEPFGGSLWAEVDRSRIITSFCCSIRPMFSVTCGLTCFFLSIVVGHLCLCCFYFLQQIFMLLFTLPFFLRGFFI